MTGSCTLDDAELRRLLAEDCLYGDLTTTSLGIGSFAGRLSFRARDDMVVAGIEEAERMFLLAGATARRQTASGDKTVAGTTLLTAEGSAAALHRTYKVAQTFTEIWSGIATAARSIAERASAADPAAKVACTRKNVPGTKAMAVKAIRAGGAIMHRLGLSETILVFAEHRAFLDEDWVVTAQRLRDEAPEKKLVVEVTDMNQAMQAAAAGFDVIQAERFSPDMIAKLSAKLARVRPRTLIAATAGINPDNVASYIAAGADIVVTSWPHTARPCDVKVDLARA